MVQKIWMNDGRLVVDRTGKLVLCADCPCDVGTGTGGTGGTGTGTGGTVSCGDCQIPTTVSVNISNVNNCQSPCSVDCISGTYNLVYEAVSSEVWSTDGYVAKDCCPHDFGTSVDPLCWIGVDMTCDGIIGTSSEVQVTITISRYIRSSQVRCPVESQVHTFNATCAPFFGKLLSTGIILGSCFVTIDSCEALQCDYDISVTG